MQHTFDPLRDPLLIEWHSQPIAGHTQHDLARFAREFSNRAGVLAAKGDPRARWMAGQWRALAATAKAQISAAAA